MNPNRGFIDVHALMYFFLVLFGTEQTKIKASLIEILMVEFLTGTHLLTFN